MAGETCKHCGSEISADASPRGICPKCLIRLALETPSGTDPPAPDETASVVPDRDVQPQRIGPYRILQKLGEGGMGIVYQAEQREPLRRTVALKLIKAGMDTAQVVARFESERQALAMMDHPGIARVFDAGSTEQGRPYFVMEYVRGVPITTYCDRHCLPTPERLMLFRRVCDAAHHAHQKGVIHRDLKPSNVLVAEDGGNPVPKIIDFGVAKATQQRLTERTLYTQLGMMVGTPEYMSPEQARSGSSDVDTRSDVYSLGVLLYELLVGALPFDPRELRQAGFEEICRRIREDEPSKPSTRLTTLGGHSAISASNRGTDTRSLTRELRGDLDWIVMKALAKEPSRRYGSASDFAEDIRRHLAHEPVIAGPPDRAYRARKFIRRHRATFAVVTLMLATVITFAVVVSALALNLAHERDRATREADTSNRVSEFLVGLFEASSPGRTKGESVTARELLDRGAGQIETELTDQPVVRARLMSVLGEVYTRLALYDEARPLLERALEIQMESGGPDPDVLGTLRALMSLEDRAGNQEAERELVARILALTEAIHGPDSPQYAIARADLLSYEWGEPYREAVEEALSASEAAWGPEHNEIARLSYNLGNYYETKGEYDRAKTLYRRALAIWDALLGEGHDNLAPLVQLGSIASKEGDFETGWALMDRALRTCLKAEGPRHSGTAGSVWQLGHMLAESGDYATAKQYFRRVYQINGRVWGARHPRVTGSIVRQGGLESMAGRYVEARALYQRALEIREADGQRTNQVASLLNTLGQLHNEYGHPERAVPLLERALDIYDETRGPSHDDVGWTLVNLAEAHRRLGDLELAGELIQRGLAIRRGAVGDDHEHVAWSLVYQARILDDMGRIEEALEVARRATVMTEKNLGSEHPDMVWPIWTQARLHLRRNDRDTAERLFRRALLIRRTQYGENHAWLFYEQGLSQAAMGDRRAAVASLRRAVDLGFPNAASLRLDPDLAWLREDGDFKAILRSIEDSDPETWVLPVARAVTRPMRPEQVAETTRLVVEDWPDDEPELLDTVGGVSRHRFLPPANGSQESD